MKIKTYSTKIRTIVEFVLVETVRVGDPQSRKNRGCLSLISNMGNQFSAIWAELKKLPKKSQL